MLPDIVKIARIFPKHSWCFAGWDESFFSVYFCSNLPYNLLRVAGKRVELCGIDSVAMCKVPLNLNAMNK